MCVRVSVSVCGLHVFEHTLTYFNWSKMDDAVGLMPLPVTMSMHTKAEEVPAAAEVA